MGQAKQRGSKEQRIAQAIERDEKQRLAYQQALAMRESPKRSAAKAMMTVAMMQAIAGGTR